MLRGAGAAWWGPLGGEGGLRAELSAISSQGRCVTENLGFGGLGRVLRLGGGCDRPQPAPEFTRLQSSKASEG